MSDITKAKLRQELQSRLANVDGEQNGRVTPHSEGQGYAAKSLKRKAYMTTKSKDNIGRSKMQNLTAVTIALVHMEAWVANKGTG